ncbi:hypothetical protein RHGRI_020814 [Rhododendron griersonianum]|uniref:Uncharacterized protein n=1 Tax=Rhododendron griersonianum TaxID=479676 RepID=A0AAV6JM98_9ERIC|nr:hypothetical protein RHGRI_020814 [Rhododendron griersonianum]
MDPSKTHNGRTPPPPFFSLKSRHSPQTPHLRRRQPSLFVNPSTLGGIVVSQAPHATTAEPNEEYSLLLPTTSSGQTKVPEVEVYLHRRGKGPIDMFKSGLGGWYQNQIEIGGILNKYGFNFVFASALLPYNMIRSYPYHHRASSAEDLRRKRRFKRELKVLHIIGFQKMSNMTSRIDGSTLSGKIPDMIGNWTKIDRMDMQGTSMSGPIPSTISELINLEELRISDLNGSDMTFPDLQNMTKLETLVLRNCLITGPIPDYIGDLPKLKYFGFVCYFTWHVTPYETVAVKLVTMTKNLVNDLTCCLACRDLSFNNLSGQIPGSLQSSDLDIIIMLDYYSACDAILADDAGY